MSKGRAYERTLDAWAKAWKTENLTDETRELIMQAVHDLWHGPLFEAVNVSEGLGYPGFTTACKRIREALDDMPRELFIDCDCEQWQTEEPEATKCETCNGQGMLDDNADGNCSQCEDCKGAGSFGAYEFGEWYKVEYEDLVAAIVGKELAGYVR
jgi:hypothetical protein